MSDRDESTKRDQPAGDESPSASRRQQAEKAGEAKQDEGPGEAGADSSTASRPRGHTEDPDGTL